MVELAIIGDRQAGYAPHDTIEEAVVHAAAALGVVVPRVRWVPTDDLDAGTGALAGASGVWCAPGGPYRSLDGALAGIRHARETGLPFLGTCAGFQHAVVEIARNVAGLVEAEHAEYGREGGDLLIHELLCSLVGQQLDVRIVDDTLAAIYGADLAREQYHCRFGLNPAYVAPLERAGLVMAGVDAADGEPRVVRLAGHPFFVATLFVPQCSSTPDRPQPVVAALVSAMLRPEVEADPPVG